MVIFSTEKSNDLWQLEVDQFDYMQYVVVKRLGCHQVVHLQKDNDDFLLLLKSDVSLLQLVKVVLNNPYLQLTNIYLTDDGVWYIPVTVPLYESESDWWRHVSSIFNTSIHNLSDLQTYVLPKVIRFILPAEVKEFALEGINEIVIGSAPSSDLIVNNRSVSRVHCLLYFEDDRIKLKDSHSKNGTIINQHVLQPDEIIAVCNGDELVVGTVRMQVEIV